MREDDECSIGGKPRWVESHPGVFRKRECDDAYYERKPHGVCVATMAAQQRDVASSKWSADCVDVWHCRGDGNASQRAP